MELSNSQIRSRSTSSARADEGRGVTAQAHWTVAERYCSWCEDTGCNRSPSPAPRIYRVPRCVLFSLLMEEQARPLVVDVYADSSTGVSRPHPGTSLLQDLPAEAPCKTLRTARGVAVRHGPGAAGGKVPKLPCLPHATGRWRGTHRPWPPASTTSSRPTSPASINSRYPCAREEMSF